MGLGEVGSRPHLSHESPRKASSDRGPEGESYKNSGILTRSWPTQNVLYGPKTFLKTVKGRTEDLSSTRIIPLSETFSIPQKSQSFDGYWVRGTRRLLQTNQL